MAPTEKITKERLIRWERRLSESHATPLVLLGVGHDHASGTLVICTLEESELDAATISAFLNRAASMLE